MCRILAFLVVVYPSGLIFADEITIDFEETAPDLPGWNAVAPTANNQSEYRLAAKWDTPFRFSLDDETPHAGSRSLKCEFTEDVPGTFNFGPEILPGSGTVEVRLFVRSQGFTEEGMVTVGEYDGGTRVPSPWITTKFSPSEDWQEVVWTGKMNPQTNGLRIRISFKSVPAGAKLWVDDITVKALAP